MRKRSLIVHFHFFKNAGTSVESILRRHFGNKFVTHEPGGPAETFPASALLPLLEKKKKIQAISSHTIRFPVPEHEDWVFFPIVFLRHPLDRILSMYNFEKNQDSDSPGAVLAREHGPAGYISARLENPGERTLRNYQAWMLSQSEASGSDDEELFRAASNTVIGLPVVGVVDEFTESVRQYTRWLAPQFPGLNMSPEHQNRSKMSSLGMNDRIRHLRDSVGEELFGRLEKENAQDMALYRMARKRLLSKA